MSSRRGLTSAAPSVGPSPATGAAPARRGNGHGTDGLVGIAAEAILRQLPIGVLVAGADGSIVLANARAAEMVGTSPDGLATTDEYARLRWFRPDGTPLDPRDWPLSRALARGEAVADEEVTVVRPDGVPVVVRASATPLRNGRAGIAGAMAILADVTSERQAREVRTYLAEAGSLLGGTLEVGEAAGALAHLAVPRIADWCSVEILEDDGSLRQAGLAHSNPEHLELARELRVRQPPQPSDPIGLHAVIRGREPVLVPEIPPEAIEDPRLDEHERALVRSLSLQSLLMIPLVAGDVAIGALNLVTAESGRRLGPEDLALAEALGSRAAAAIQNARLVEDLRRFKAVLDATHEGIVIVDGPSRRVEYANHAAGALFGDDQASLVGRPIETLVSAGRRALRAAFTAVATRPGTGRRVTLRVGPPGAGRPVELSLQALASEQAGNRVVGIARDVGERIEAAERMRRLVAGQRARAAELDAVIRAIGDGLVVVAGDGRSGSPTRPPSGCSRASRAGRGPTWSPASTAGAMRLRTVPSAARASGSVAPAPTSAGSRCPATRRRTSDGPRQRRRHRRPPRRDRGAPAPAPPRHLPRRPVARSCARRSRRSTAPPRSWPATTEGARARTPSCSPTSPTSRSGSSASSRTSSPSSNSARTAATSGVSPSCSSASSRRPSRPSGGGGPVWSSPSRWRRGFRPWSPTPCYLEQVVRNLLGNAAKYAGPGGPVLGHGAGGRRRGRGSACWTAGPASTPTSRRGSSRSPTVRRPPPPRPPGPGSASSSALASSARSVAGSGAGPGTAVAPSSASPSG